MLICQTIRHVKTGFGLGRIFVIVSLLLVMVQTNAIEACHKAHVDAISFKSLYRDIDTDFGLDEYSADKHIQKFWLWHNRFGVVRAPNDRILLVTLNRARAEQLVAELREYSGEKTKPAPYVKDSPILRGRSVDVTDIAGPWVKKLLDFQPKRQGPNCWNFCLMHAGILQHFRFTTGEEFRHWLSGPLAEEVKGLDQLKPGDIFALTSGRDEVHGAIAVSPNLVLSKTGRDLEYGYRLMDIREMLGLFEQSASKSNLRVYRLQSLETLERRGNLQWPERLQAEWRAVDALERKLEKEYIGALEDGGNIPLRVLEIHAYAEARLPVIFKEVKKLKAQAGSDPQRDLLLHLWIGLLHRVDSLLQAY